MCYFGNGRESDGAWCFKFGYLTFEDIIRLYKEYFAGKEMTIVLDSTSSYKWIQKYHIHLDSLKVRPCGHFGRKAGKFLQLIATSSAHDQGCPSCNAFAVRGLHTNSHGVTYIQPDGFEIHTNQHLSYCSPFSITCDNMKMEDPCTMPEGSTWCRDSTLGQRIVLLRSNDGSRWAYVHVLEDQDMVKVKRDILRDSHNYLEIIKEGDGCGPPDHVRKHMHVKYPLLDQSY